MADLSMSFDPALVATNSDAASSALAEANAASSTATAASSAIAAQSAAWEAVANPLTSQLGIGEHDLKLDSLLSAAEKYSGITCDGVLGATLAFGDLVYLATTDQRWELADADAEATAGDVRLAIVLAAGDDGDTRLLLLQGFVRTNAYWALTEYGKALFVSRTAGGITQDVSGYATGDIVRMVGYASTLIYQIYFNPCGTWIEVA